MSEPEKKGSPWPWILVPVAAISLFFVLRECRQKLPPAQNHAPAPAANFPPAPDSPAPVDATPAEPGTTPAPEPAPQ